MHWSRETRLSAFLNRSVAPNNGYSSLNRGNKKHFQKLINRKRAELTTMPITYLEWSLNSATIFQLHFSSVEKLKLIDMAFVQSNRLSWGDCRLPWLIKDWISDVPWRFELSGVDCMYVLSRFSLKHGASFWIKAISTRNIQDIQ